MVKPVLRLAVLCSVFTSLPASGAARSGPCDFEQKLQRAGQSASALDQGQLLRCVQRQQVDARGGLGRRDMDERKGSSSGPSPMWPAAFGRSDLFPIATLELVERLLVPSSSHPP